MQIDGVPLDPTKLISGSCIKKIIYFDENSMIFRNIDEEIHVAL